MPNTYTTGLKLVKPGLNDAGWGTTVNDRLTDLVDQAVVGSVDVAVTSGGTTTLPTIADGTSSDARNMTLVITGSLTSVQTATVRVPATVTGIAKLYSVINSAGGTVTVETSGGASVAVPDGRSMLLRVTSAGVYEAVNYSASFTVGSTLFAPKFAPTGGTATGNGMYLPATNTLAWSTNGVEGMRLDASGNLGVGTTSPAYKLVVQDPSAATIQAFTSSSGNVGFIANTAAGGTAFLELTNAAGSNYIYGGSGGTQNISFAINGEKMRLDSSGNLGIGTSSPAYTLDVLKNVNTQVAVRISNSDSGTAASANFITSNGSVSGEFGIYGVNTTTAGALQASDTYIYTGVNVANKGITLMANAANGVIKFATGGLTERMRLDASGNLGLGVTPSAWTSGSSALQVGNVGYTALSQATGGDSNLTSNVYLSAASTWTAIASLGASRYQLDFGAHKWYTAPSGTAGNAITFTQAMTLDASGNLGVTGSVSAASMSLTTALPATSGGTGQSSYAVGDLLYASSTTALSKLTAGATNTILTISGGVPQWTSATAILQLLYPVGSVYLNATNATNPGTLLGFGTWVAFGAGRVPVGFDSTNVLFDTAEETGGSADAVVVSHTHTITDSGHSHTTTIPTSATGNSRQALYSTDNAGTTATITSSTATTGISVNTTGSSGTNANYQPYITVYMWKRTA